MLYSIAMDSIVLKTFQHQNLEILKFLANGNYGDVSLIYDREMDRKVVGNFIGNKQHFSNANREANILAQFNHPNIINVLGELN